MTKEIIMNQTIRDCMLGVTMLCVLGLAVKATTGSRNHAKGNRAQVTQRLTEGFKARAEERPNREDWNRRAQHGKRDKKDA